MTPPFSPNQVINICLVYTKKAILHHCHGINASAELYISSPLSELVIKVTLSFFWLLFEI